MSKSVTTFCFQDWSMGDTIYSSWKIQGPFQVYAKCTNLDSHKASKTRHAGLLIRLIKTVIFKGKNALSPWVEKSGKFYHMPRYRGS